METKTCCSCKHEKLVEDFAKCHSAKDGLQPHCRACQSARWARYKATHGDKVRAKQAEHHANPDVKARKSANRTSEDGKAKARAYMAEYRKKNRAKIRAYERQYVDRLRAAGGTWTEEDWELLLSVYGYRCLACGSKDRLVADHVIPVSLGGTNSISNRQPLCHSCNSKKNDGTTDFRPPETLEAIRSGADLSGPDDSGKRQPQTRSRRRYLGRRARLRASQEDQCRSPTSQDHGPTRGPVGP